MGQSEYVAALDLGSSKIIVMAGKKNEQGMLSVIASEKEDAGACIRRGCVHNVEETADKIKSLISKLNRNIGVSMPIEKVYVGVGGQSLHTETHSVSKDVNAIVSQEMLDLLLNECKQYEPEFAEILDIVSPEYYLDGQLESNPKGIQCSKIEGRFKLILGRPLIKRTLKKSIEEKANLKIAGYIVAPIATATAVLNETEKELGCALVELGAGITYLSIYKKGLLKQLISIPLGGKVITKDICSLNILEDEAENLKVNFGSALTEFDNNIKAETAKMAEGYGNNRKIQLNELNNIIEARVDEILANVIAQIKTSGYADTLGAGIVITGGGAIMKNMVDSIRNKTGMEVRLGAVKKTLSNQAVEWTQDYANTEIIGLLALGKENCAKISKTEPIQVQPELFTEDEVPVGSNDRFTRKMPEEKKKPAKNERLESGGGFLRSLTKRFDNLGKSLFDEESQDDKDE